jgi:soluble lytic murein transglycosylase
MGLPLVAMELLRRGEARRAALGMAPLRTGPASTYLAAWLLLIGSGSAMASNALVAPAPSEALLSRPGWALRAAVQAMRSDEDARAVLLLREVSERHAVVADQADLLRVQVLARGVDPAAAISAAREAVARHAESPLRPRLLAALGDALLASGDEAAAREAWERALARSEARRDRARLLRALAESHEREGETAAAARRWLEIWKRYPLSGGADPAEVRLREIEPTLPKPLRSGLDYRGRGDALRAEGHNAEAIAAYDEALARDLLPRDRRRTMRSRAQCLFALRRYEEAIPAFEALKPDPDSAVWRARSIARAGDVPAAVAELEAIAGGRWGRTSVYARYLAALLLEDEDELARARRHFENVAKQAAHPRYANPSVWYLGWTAWRAGDWREAQQRFELLTLRLADDPIAQLRARYWGARAAEKLGEASAVEQYATLAREFPFTYYGWRAGHRAGTVEPPVRMPVESGRRGVAPTDLARARILLEADLVEEAVQDLVLRGKQARGLHDRLDIARLLAGAGEYHRAQALVLGPYVTELARGVAPGQEDLWWLAWPAAFAALVEELAPPEAVIDAAVVSAVMREESGYRPGVTSPAGALGLLQIMPETGRRLASQLGLSDFTPNDLYRPRVNIQLGAFYLDQLTRQFDGRLEAAIASYNAGPQAAARWTEEQPGLEDDEWVEAVPYSQTRAYVKRVLRSVHAYRELY